MPTVTEWAITRFGADAEVVTTAVVGGLRAGHLRAVNAQAGGELNTADAYGSVLWLAVPQQILRRIARIDGADRIKPPRARYTLGVVHDQVIYPQRISADLRTSPTAAQLTVSKVKADLFTLAPAPYEHPSLFDVEDGESLDTTADDAADFNPASLILVAYASSHDGGLLGAWWGEAALLDDGRLDWRPHRAAGSDAGRRRPPGSARRRRPHRQDAQRVQRCTVGRHPHGVA